MAKQTIHLPLRGTPERDLAVAIWEHIQAPNPHGPQRDLYFEMPYCREYAEEATVIARDLIEKGFTKWPPKKVSADDLAKRGRPEVVVPAEGIVALVAEDSSTIDMTTIQAIRLRLISEIPGHTSHVDISVGEELWLSCSCGKLQKHMDGGDIEEVWSFWQEHLEQILNRPRLKDLPDGVYFDGTYEWEKDGGEWMPLNAPQGMPRYPDRDKLKRVQKTYEEIV